MAAWAGKDSGDFCVPDVGDPVYVSFENGKIGFPMYMGGWWPKVDGTNYAEAHGAYNADGVPTKRSFRTKAGHELSFEDDAGNESVTLAWRNPEKDVTTNVVIDSDGTLKMMNHNGAYIELNASEKDEESFNMVVDSNGNSIVQNKDGTKIIDLNGNLVELQKDLIKVTGAKELLAEVAGMKFVTEAMEIGSSPSDSALKGTAFLSYWNQTLKIWLDTHTHPTGVGPSGPPVAPSQAPVDQQVLSEVLTLK
jgi:hypothetical protein